MFSFGQTASNVSLESVPEPATSLRSIEARYRTLLELGRGGMARVYLAKSRLSGLRKLVVLKTLEPELSTNAEMRELFLREAQTCARLNHPNIVQVHEVIEAPTGPVIVMEYLEGIAVSQAIAGSEGRFSKRLYLHAITQTLAGLHYFHELRDYDHTTQLNAVHRDVSPQNVILLYEGAVKVLDFGIAKLATENQATRTGIVKGKLHYMPSEQLMSDGKLDRRADIFATGVMLWEALAERRMWQGHSENTIVRALVTGQLPKLKDVASGYPEYFYDIVNRATAFESTERFATALEMQLEVERMLGDLGEPVHPRELSAFMQAEFGEYRRQRETAIEAAIRLSVPPASLATVSESLSSLSGQPEVSRSATITGQTRAPKRKAIFFTVTFIIALVSLGALFVLRRHAQRPAPVAQPVAQSVASQRILPGLVHFAVESNPTGASVWLDGMQVGVTPWVADIPSKKEPRTLELKAENFETVTKTILPTSDFAAEIMLEPSRPAAQNAHEDTDRVVHSKHVKAVTSPKPPVASPGAGSANCTPPYTLSSDGIRTYKAECFADGTR